ncbi:MAG: hypothetical protein JWN24_3592 [Phycisphaerales bacterium]|nr:hypothetical protein [Phycisphaerales bacterium]
MSRRVGIKFEDDAVRLAGVMLRACPVRMLCELQAEQRIKRGRPVDVGNTQDDEIEASDGRVAYPSGVSMRCRNLAPNSAGSFATQDSSIKPTSSMS